MKWFVPIVAGALTVLPQDMKPAPPSTLFKGVKFQTPTFIPTIEDGTGMGPVMYIMGDKRVIEVINRRNYELYAWAAKYNEALNLPKPLRPIVLIPVTPPTLLVPAVLPSLQLPRVEIPKLNPKDYETALGNIRELLTQTDKGFKIVNKIVSLVSKLSK